VGYPVLIVLTLVFVSGIFSGGACFCFYQYRLYQLTKFSERWRPWKNSMIGILALEIGIVFAVLNLFYGVFITYPDLFDVNEIFIPIFILIYAVLTMGALGIWWAGLGLRAYWKEVLKIATETANQ